MMEYSTADALAPLAVWLNNQFLRLCSYQHKRKNYLFAGSKAGGERAAVMYTILGTAKLNDINPNQYLTAVLKRIGQHPINKVDELLPWNIDLSTPAKNVIPPF